MPNKFYLLLFVISILNLHSYAQNTAIPDNNFEQALIDLGLDTGPLDNLVPTANINTITNLDVSQSNITDLTGIADFTALTMLDCSDNLLTTLNVSNNTSLTDLFCFNNLLTTLNVTPLSNLVRLWCHQNQLINLDVSNNNQLISLRCESNNISILNITENLELRVIACNNNNIQQLNTSNNSNLERLLCGRNLLSNLDLRNNLNLTFLSFEENQIEQIDVSNNLLLNIIICFQNKLTTLDLSNNSNLTDVNCSNNALCLLNIKNGNNANLNSINFSLNTELNCIIVDNIDADRSIWIPQTFSNYAESEALCGNFVPIDRLDNFVGVSYTLPELVFGEYFTSPNKLGTQLNAGDVISTSQTIFIYNALNCISTNSSFSVLIDTSMFFIPKFFTPNNDGKNDFWKVVDANNNINSISIYNRHGKLLKFLPQTSSGWDGTYNGQLLPTDSYWYKIVLNNQNIVKGFFALKR
ncbi:T9SS type B sorting domain-containing protein [Hyunsoonleella sp. 2307UL5-6]|uniref:T9SS type B sorting domain-containing protein n=1 Tax=Hyunsoonleella sp. 2307UL5-6 TaxID=3384768 RepID=UPI0039BC910B